MIGYNQQLKNIKQLMHLLYIDNFYVKKDSKCKTLFLHQDLIKNIKN